MDRGPSEPHTDSYPTTEVHDDRCPSPRLLSGAMLFVAMASSLGFAAATSLPASAATTGGACEAVAPNYEGSAVVTVDKTQVTPGETLTLTGKGFPPGAEVQILVNGKVVGSSGVPKYQGTRSRRAGSQEIWRKELATGEDIHVPLAREHGAPSF